MAILSFPTNPNTNETYTFGTKTWVWNGTAWQLQTSGAINNIPIGNAIPSTGAFTTLTAATLTGGVVSITGNITGSNIQGGNVILSGNSIVGPANLTLGSSNTVISGNLFVQGNTTFINSNVISTNDLILALANNATLGTTANGAGITVGQSPGNIFASMLYNNYSNVWSFIIGLSTAGNVQALNYQTSGVVSATGNIRGGNIVTAGAITATGNITGNYFYGNGSTLTGVTNFSNANAAAYGESGWAGNIVPAVDSFYSLGNSTSAWKELWLSGNSLQIGGGTLSVSNANLLFNGNVLVTQQGNTGNISANNISLTGNAVASYFVGDGSLLTNINAGNITGAYGNANVAAYLPTYTGNLTAGNISVAGNITGNNLIANNSVVWSNNGAPAVYQLYNASTGSLDTIFE